MKVARTSGWSAMVVLAALCTLAAAVTLPAAPALAATALPPPGTPQVTALTQTSVTISWTPSAGPVADYTVQVIDEPMGVYHDIARTSATTYKHTGLTPDTVYVYRLIANATAGSGQTASDPSGYTFVTTLPPPDSVPPTKPGTPTVSSISTVAAAINYYPSTDNHRVAGYVAQRQINGVWTDISTNNNTVLYLNGLTPATSYTVVVVAFDANGNRSVPSDPVTFTTRATQPLPTCRVQIQDLRSQYILSVTVENMTAAMVLTNWAVTFTMPATHTVNYSFSTTLTRTGDQASAGPVSYNPQIGPGGGTSFGINANYPSGSPLPSGFRFTAAGLNSLACSTS